MVQMIKRGDLSFKPQTKPRVEEKVTDIWG